MSAEVQNAMNSLIVAIILVGGTLLSGLGLLIKAYFDRRIQKMKDDVKIERENQEQLLLDREQKRQLELEEMKRKTAEAQEKAERAETTNERLTEFAGAMLRMSNDITGAIHATTVQLTNNAQSLGDVVESVDKLAIVTDENTNRSRAVINAIGELKISIDTVSHKVDNIEIMLRTPPLPPTVTVNNVTPVTPDEKKDTAA